MHLGVNAIIVGRNAEGLQGSADELSKTTGRKCLAASADVRDAEGMKKAVEVAVKDFGKIDFVICGAAGNFLAPLSGLSERAFKTVIDIDLLGTYNTIKATLPYIRSSRGAYIHISATLHYRGTPWQAHVSAAKAGVDALSAVVAVEEGPRGVRSNVIAPGPIAGTVGMDKLSPKSGFRTETLPLGRMGDTVDIANAAIFLFSPAAQYISGAVVVVDGAAHHVSTPIFPYPDAVLYPENIKEFKARL